MPKLWGGASQNVVSEEDENEMENVDDGKNLFRIQNF